MIETRRGGWFAPGCRVLYVVPQAFTDKVLPATVTPQPAVFIRVMVGQIDIVRVFGC